MKITNNSEYHVALEQIERYIERGFSSLSGNETEDLVQLSIAVEAFEKTRFPMPVIATSPAFPEPQISDSGLNKSDVFKASEDS